MPKKIEYPITEIFKQVKYITIEGVAERAGMNKSLLRQYAKGIKDPSQKQIERINEALTSLGNELKNVKISQIV